MIFDWTISLGNILTIVGFVGAGVSFVLFMRSDILVLANRVSNLEGATRELVQANLAFAEQKGRMETLDDRMNNLSSRVDMLLNVMIKTNDAA